MPRKKPTPPPPKTHERGWSEGSVIEVRPGRFRAFRARQHHADGTSSRPSRTFASREAAESWARGEVEPDVLYLGAWLDHWLALRLPTVGPRAKIIYRRYVVACLPIAALPLADVTTEILQAHINTLLARWARTYVANWRSVMSGAFADAVPRYIPHNPMRGTRLPKAVETPPQAWTADEVAQLVEDASGRVHEAWLWLSIGTGIRLGESRALTWPDIDMAAKTVTVSKSMDQETNDLGPPKGRRTRIVNVPDEVIALLAAHKLRQRPHERRVIATVKGRLPAAKSIRHWVERLCARAGVTPLPPHSTRHTFATHSLENPNVSLKEVSEALGHSSVAVTANVYTHALERRSRNAANAMGAVLAPKPAPKRGHGSEVGTRKAR